MGAIIMNKEEYSLCLQITKNGEKSFETTDIPCFFLPYMITLAHVSNSENVTEVSFDSEATENKNWFVGTISPTT